MLWIVQFLHSMNQRSENLISFYNALTQTNNTQHFQKYTISTQLSTEESPKPKVNLFFMLVVLLVKFDNFWQCCCQFTTLYLFNIIVRKLSRHNSHICHQLRNRHTLYCLKPYIWSLDSKKSNEFDSKLTSCSTAYFYIICLCMCIRIPKNTKQNYNLDIFNIYSNIRLCTRIRLILFGIFSYIWLTLA